MKIELLDKRKRNVIILSILAFLFLVGGSFLLWRVNQVEELSPTLSDAGGGNGACCYKDIGCVSGWICTSTYCGGSAGSGIYSCSQFNGNETGCKSSGHCFWDGSVCYTGTCVRQEEGPPEEGDCQNVKCEWPKVVMSHKNCACELCGGANSSICQGNPPECTPPGCPSGQIDCGTSATGSMHPECVKVNSKFCWAYHPDCNNPTVVYRYCRPESPPEEQVNECDGGNWISRPSGTYPYCDEIKYSFLAKDSDGVDKGTIVVKLNGDVRVNASKTTVETGDTEVRVQETLSNQTNCLEPGEYTLNTNWKDKKGAGGPETQCVLSATFTVLEEVKNPDWEIRKVVAESCIDENTENPKSRLQYTVTITNKGEGSGQILSIEDSLDSKVLEEYVENISSNGQFSNGLITWTLTGADRDFAPSQSKTYTYSYIVLSDAFGIYENTVEAKPSDGATLIANASISADCIILEDEEIDDEDLPETGIFGDGQSSIVVGFVLLFLGFTWRFVGRGVLVSFKSISLTKERVVKSSRMKKSIDRKRKFERKIIGD